MLLPSFPFCFQPFGSQFGENSSRFLLPDLFDERQALNHLSLQLFRPYPRLREAGFRIFANSVVVLLLVVIIAQEPFLHRPAILAQGNAQVQAAVDEDFPHLFLAFQAP